MQCWYLYDRLYNTSKVSLLFDYYYSSNLPFILILIAFILVLVMILVIVIATPNKNAIITPVTREVKKTMSYARMSTHLLTPLMECDEDLHSTFVGSHTEFQQTVSHL